MMRLSFRTHRFLDTVKVYALAAVIVACMAVAVWLSWTTSMRRAETRGRASLVREAEQWIAASNSAWRVRMVESLAVAHRQRDTAVASRIAESRVMARRVAALIAGARRHRCQGPRRVATRVAGRAAVERKFSRSIPEIPRR